MKKNNSLTSLMIKFITISAISFNSMASNIYGSQTDTTSRQITVTQSLMDSAID